MESSQPPQSDQGRQPRPLLVSKITAPLLRPGTVTRNRLLERLDEDGARRLSVVVAPAGWGKTTLLAAWAERAAESASVAWLTLDETDDEPNRFWTHVITALQTVAPEIGTSALVRCECLASIHWRWRCPRCSTIWPRPKPGAW